MVALRLPGDAPPLAIGDPLSFTALNDGVDHVIEREGGGGRRGDTDLNAPIGGERKLLKRGRSELVDNAVELLRGEVGRRWQQGGLLIRGHGS